MLFFLFSILAACQESLAEQKNHLKARDVWITMSLGTLGLIIALAITVWCFRETDNSIEIETVDYRSLLTQENQPNNED